MAAVMLAVAASWVLAACGGSSHSATNPATTSETAATPDATATQAADPALSKPATLTGPITVGTVSEPESAYPLILPTGYEQQEFFAAGNAVSLRATATPTDGKWTTTPSTSAAYKTRILVRRPTDPAAFNGTVVVEWMNVSSGESAPDWDFLNPSLTAAGYAYVAVSAQELGVDGGKALLGSGASKGLVGLEPSRYGSLHQPGDQYSFDIFAQVGQALRDGGNPAVLGALSVKHVVAVGESQSAFFLTTFANAFQPQTHTFDGIFIHSRGGTGAPLDGKIDTATTTGPGQQIRTDLSIPVFMFETESDLTTLGYSAAEQPNTRLIRTWEVAGTAHADTYVVGSFASSLGCKFAINDGPQHVVLQAAFAAFDTWVTTGVAPASPARIAAPPGKPADLLRDADGNVEGGIRTPAVDVPVSTLSGLAVAGATPICSLFGSTVVFSAAKLRATYGTSASYLTRYTASLDATIKAGFILPADRASLLKQAGAVSFG